MKFSKELQFFVYVFLISAAWVPVAAWLMPRIASAPTWDANPQWYLSSALMGIVLAYALRLLVAKLSRPGKQ